MSLLLFDIGGEQYGLELKALQEVADDPPMHFVPGGGDFVAGVINLHGRILPVIDLRVLFGCADGGRDPRLLVLTPEFRNLALAVSGVGRIVPFAAEDLQLPPAGLALPAVTGVIEIAAQRVHLLDVGAVIERLQKRYAA
jgi:chemotaxis signal transduction protein